MSKTMTLTLPDDVYDAIVEAAKTEGESPQEWIVSQLPKGGNNGVEEVQSNGPQQTKGTLAEALGSYIGSVRSDSPKPLSENTGEAFTDYLEQKRREGKL